MPTLSEIGGFIDPLADGARNAAQEIQRMEERVNSLSRTTRSVAEQQNNLIQMLTTSMNGMQNQLGTLVQAMQNFNSTTSSGRQNIERTSVDINQMFEVYKKMGVEVSNLELDLKTLTFTQSEYNKVIKLGNDYNDKRINAYEQLSRKYSALKILWNNMTDAEKESTEAGRNMAAMLRDIYQQMNLMQQSTGKYQLQVGDYSKAMTGLNIATQQVIREMPVLAQSAQMFVMAISNNIPILLDNIKAVKLANDAQISLRKSLIEAAEAAKIAGDMDAYNAKMAEANAIKTTSAAKGLLSSVLSWQTAVVLLLSVLPKVIKTIQDKRKAMEEAAKSGKDLANALKIVAESVASVDADATKAINTISSMTAIMDNDNRTMEDRIDAVKVLREETGHLLDKYTDMEVIEGKATAAINNHTEALIRQANAQGYLNKIASLADKRADIEYKRIELMFREEEIQENLNILREKEAQQNKENQEYYDTYGARSGAGFVALANDYTQARIAQEEALKAVQKELDELDVEGQFAQLDKAQKLLLDRLDPTGLLEAILAGKKGKTVKDKAANLGDYYYDYLESIYNLNEDAYEREYQLLDLQYKRQIKAAEDRLAKERETGQLSKEQEEYQLKIIENLREAHGKALVELTEKQEQEMRDTKFEAEVQALKDEKYIRDNNAKEIYKSDVLEKRHLIQNEIDYWKEYLQILRQNGKLTVEEYDKIMSNISKLEQDKSETLPMTFLALYGMATNTKFTRKQEQNLKKMYSTATKYMKEWMNTRVEMAKIAVEAAEKETEATKKMLDYEMEARANGYAYNIEYARKEYEEKLKLQREAVREQERLERIQEQIDTATQISSLTTATAELWASFGKAGPYAVALAIAATAAMWTSFIGAKAQAAQLARKKMYGEGGAEYLDYGGSHASGNDIDFGTTKDGTRRTVERGEVVGIINKRNVNKYGVSTIKGIIKSLNNGTFEDKYGLAYTVNAGGNSADLKRLESGVDSLVAQGEKRIYTSGNKTIEVSKHSKRIILN